MSGDHTTKLTNLIRQITINIANKNINCAIKDGETLKANLDALTKSGNNIEIILQKIKEASLISFETIECILNDPTYYVFTNTIKRNDGEKFLLKFYNHIESERNFKSAIELFQSNLIRNKCLELMACTNGMQYETSINLTRKVLQLPNEHLLNAFVNKLCTHEYPDISINDLMEIFLIEPHEPEFIASELIRETYVTSMEATLQREIVNEIIQLSKCLFNDNVSMELLVKCCQRFYEFHSLIKTMITKCLNFIERMETDNGDVLWYFNNENLSANLKFNDFAKFVYNLASSTDNSFTNDFLLFLKNSFESHLLHYIFVKFQ